MGGYTEAYICRTAEAQATVDASQMKDQGNDCPVGRPVAMCTLVFWFSFDLSLVLQSAFPTAGQSVLYHGSPVPGLVPRTEIHRLSHIINTQPTALGASQPFTFRGPQSSYFVQNGTILAPISANTSGNTSSLKSIAHALSREPRHVC